MSELNASTRDRIIAEATRLFAAQGIKSTTVAQIEEAVGLRKGSGGVHRHFATKDTLIRAVLDTQLQAGRATHNLATAMSPPTPHQVHDFLKSLGEFALAESERSREVALIMLREAHVLPKDLLDEHTRLNLDIAYAGTADAVREMQGHIGHDAGVDADALGYLLMAPLIYFRLIEWATGARLFDLDDETLIDTWATVFEPIFRELTASGDE